VSPADPLQPSDRVIACQALAPELAALGVPESKLTLLDQGLHRYPQDLKQELARALARLEQDPAVERVIMVYGYCGGGLEGLASSRVELVLPRAHDCVPLLLGQPSARAAVETGGAFYLSPGWIDHGNTPYSEYFRTRQRFGHDDALWTSKEMLGGYQDVVLVETVAGLGPDHRRYARQMCRLFGLSYREAPGSADFLLALLTAQDHPEVIKLPPGRKLSKDVLPAVSP